MEVKKILSFSSILDYFILVSIICPLVHSLPFSLEENIIKNNNHLKLLADHLEWVLGGSSAEILNDLQIEKGFDFIKGITEKSIELIYDRLLDLFTLPFDHPKNKKIHNDTEAERNRECQAPESCFTKKQGENSCTFCEDDMSAATDLINYFHESRNASEFLDVAEKCKQVLNEYLFNYAFTYILIAKFPGFEYPSIVEVFPGMFINKNDLNTVKQEVSKKNRLKRQVGSSNSVRVFVDSVFNGEQNVNYFKEDYGYNSHHYNWHLVHRVGSNIDRKGELFWYMHHQMLARYDLERMSLGLDRVRSSGPLNQPIAEGYFPNLDPSANGNEWASRRDNTLPRDIVENGRITTRVQNIQLWHSRLSQAVRDGFMRTRAGQRVELSDDVNINIGARRGIDIFGAAVEADREISPNPDFYGNLHNTGHNIIAQAHDPENRQRTQSMGVMSSTAVGARDPVFYMWHKYVEDLFQEYKRTQRPYSLQQLELVNIFLIDVEVGIDSVNTGRKKRQSFPIFFPGDAELPETIDGELLGSATAENNPIQSELLTGCNTYGIDISRGLDFGNERSNVIIELNHLDHVPFHYNIFVRNDRPERKNVMVRIFMAPKFGTDGQIIPLHEQQHLFVLLDKFRYILNPGQNIINRLSTESSVTSKCRNSRRDSTRESFTDRGIFGGGHCGCGWPHHLLLPRGSPQGMMFQLFVILTDWDTDYVPSGNTVSSFCGVMGDRYPDWQPMGYPFDRPFNQIHNFVDQLAENLSNAHVSDVSVRFTRRNIITNENTC